MTTYKFAGFTQEGAVREAIQYAKVNEIEYESMTFKKSKFKPTIWSVVAIARGEEDV